MREAGTAALVAALLLVFLACTSDDEEPSLFPGEQDSVEEVTPAEGGSEERSAAVRLRFEAHSAGVDFVHDAARSDARHLPEVMGAGVAIADFDRDGAPDLLFIDSGPLVPGPRETGGNRLYLGDGTGSFQDATAIWGLPSPALGLGVTAGDLDGDGYPDVVLSHFGAPPMVLRNKKGGGFEIVEQGGALAAANRFATSMALLDLENDGDLDLYVASYLEFDPNTAVPCYTKSVHSYCGPSVFAAQQDRLYRNDGSGHFIEVTEEAGLGASSGKGLAVAAGDIDRDGDVDVYVANDLTPNHLWTNDGTGKFEDLGAIAGVAYSELGIEEAGMGSDFSDIDGDGQLDIVCTNFQGQPDALYRQVAPLVFREVSDAIGLGVTARARLAFGIDFFDADNDGDEDLLVANGHIHHNVHEYAYGATFAQRNTLYRNEGDGRFADVTAEAGPALEVRAVSRGLATGDLDGDGDLDFVSADNDAAPVIGWNQSENVGQFVSLWLEGAEANRSAIGARVVAEADGRRIERQVSGAESYLSRSDARVHLGLGSATRVDRLEIHWPGGRAPQVAGPLEAGRFYHLRQGGEPVAYTPGVSTIAP